MEEDKAIELVLESMLEVYSLQQSSSIQSVSMVEKTVDIAIIKRGVPTEVCTSKMMFFDGLDPSS